MVDSLGGEPCCGQSRLIHLPEQVVTRLRKVRRIAAQLSQDNGQDALPEQIAEAASFNLDEVKHLLSLFDQPVSLDSPVDDEARYSLADMIEDSADSAFVETASPHLLDEELDQALALFSPRERTVITMRYGIGDGMCRTLLEVGKELGISRERVRQLEARSLMKLRCPSRTRIIMSIIGRPLITPQQYELLHGGGAEAAEIARERLQFEKHVDEALKTLQAIH